MKTQKYYVTMTDKFMSGWGMAQDTVNKLVIACDTLDEAEIVAANARRRHEMRHVSIRMTKPYYPNAYVSLHDKNDYTSWFTPHYDWE